MATKTKGRKVYIPENQYRELEEFAKKHDLTVDQLANQLLEKEIVDSAHKELFIPGLKWDTPKESIIMARILEEDYPRIRKWLENHDDIQILTAAAENELWLMNETLLSQKKKLPVDEETYAKLEARAKEKGVTLEEYVVELSKTLAQ